jgi:hypothetical protein
MTHQPTVLDAATDLQRCVYSSYSPQGFSDPNYLQFLQHSLNIFNKTKNQINPQIFNLVNQRLQKAQDPQAPDHHRREDLAMASTLLATAIPYQPSS